MVIVEVVEDDGSLKLMLVVVGAPIVPGHEVVALLQHPQGAVTRLSVGAVCVVWRAPSDLDVLPDVSDADVDFSCTGDSQWVSLSILTPKIVHFFEGLLEPSDDPVVVQGVEVFGGAETVEVHDGAHVASHRRGQLLVRYHGLQFLEVVRQEYLLQVIAIVLAATHAAPEVEVEVGAELVHDGLILRGLLIVRIVLVNSSHNVIARS